MENIASIPSKFFFLLFRALVCHSEKHKTLLSYQAQLELSFKTKPKYFFLKKRKKEPKALTDKKWEKKWNRKLTHSRGHKRKYSTRPLKSWQALNIFDHLLNTLIFQYVCQALYPACSSFGSQTIFFLNYLFPQITQSFLEFKEWQAMNIFHVL